MISEDGCNWIVNRFRKIANNTDNILVIQSSQYDYIPVLVNKARWQLAKGETVAFFVLMPYEAGMTKLLPVSIGDYNTDRVLQSLENSIQAGPPYELTSTEMGHFAELILSSLRKQ